VNWIHHLPYNNICKENTVNLINFNTNFQSKTQVSAKGNYSLSTSGLLELSVNYTEETLISPNNFNFKYN
jgi:hypothetical protein